METIPVARPIMPITQELLPYLERIDASHVYSNFGPLVLQLESELSEYLSIPKANICTTSSATLAIAGLLATSGITKRKIKTPSWTFTATPAAIHQSGFIPHFIDVDPLTWESDIPTGPEPGVHVLPFGASMVSALANERDGLEPMIIDAAASFDSLNKLNLPTNRSWAIAVSLHATKLLGAGEGGFVYSNDREWIQRFKAWTNFGFAGQRNSILIGTNAKMSEYHAAVGLASLNKWDKNRLLINELQDECLAISHRLELNVHPSMRRREISPYWIVQLENHFVKQSVISSLEKHKIEFRNWWSAGAHLMPAYSNDPHDESLAVTRNLAQSTLGLPFQLGLGDKELNRIEQALHTALS